MDQLFAIAVQIVAVATVLALLVAIVTRIVKHPPLAHSLWLLVLVKLVVPPLVYFEFWSGSPEAGAARTVEQPVAEVPGPSMPHSPRVVGNGTEVRSSADELPGPAAARRSRITLAAWNTMVPALMWIWLIGAGLAGLIAAFRIVRFHRALGGTLPASQRVQSIADGLAVRIGLRRSPDIRVVNAATAPFVWGLGGRSRVVLPRRLLDALDEQQTAMVLAHELAHLRRRDHWARLVELIVSVLHWWNPLIWWVRRRLHCVEEQCCDAWAKWAFPDRNRDYAKCLLKAAELSSPAPLPRLASPFLHSSGLKERIEMVLKNDLRRSVSRRDAIFLAVLAVVVVPVGVYSGQGGTDEATAADIEPALPNTDASAIASVVNPSAGTRMPVSPEIERLQGAWEFGACESLAWHSKLSDVQTWKWVIQGREITWIRPGRESVKMSFTVDAGKLPKRIDLKFLNGPHKGENCRGIYKIDPRGSLWVCVTDPGSKVTRPTEIGFASYSERSLLLLQKPAEAWTADKTYTMREFHSDKWTADANEVRSWKWTFRGREITWSRPGMQDVKLSFTTDPSKSPKQIDLTFLSGPDKGHKCLGSYIASRHHVWLCFQDPGAQVHRATTFKFRPGGEYTTISMTPDRIATSAEEVAALQGTWKFDMCTTDWWPHTPEQRNWRWHVERNVIHWTGLSTGDVKLSFALNPATSPRQIDLTFLNGPRTGEKLEGIYQAFSDDSCQFCLTDPDTRALRPGSFSYSTGEGRTLIIVELTDR